MYGQGPSHWPNTHDLPGIAWHAKPTRESGEVVPATGSETCHCVKLDGQSSSSLSFTISHMPPASSTVDPNRTAWHRCSQSSILCRTGFGLSFMRRDVYVPLIMTSQTVGAALRPLVYVLTAKSDRNARPSFSTASVGDRIARRAHEAIGIGQDRLESADI